MDSTVIGEDMEMQVVVVTHNVLPIRSLRWQNIPSSLPVKSKVYSCGRVRHKRGQQNSVKKDKEEKRMVCRDRKVLCQDICYCFADLSCAWISHMNKFCFLREGWKGYFVIATNVSAVHCVLQRQPAFPCLLRSLYYRSMPWSFRDRIIFFALNGNY